MPIVVPFYESNGLSMKDIMILQAVYSIAIVVLEIPSGYLADVIGRRKTLIHRGCVWTVGIYHLQFQFWFPGVPGSRNYPGHRAKLYFRSRFGHAIRLPAG